MSEMQSFDCQLPYQCQVDMLQSTSFIAMEEIDHPLYLKADIKEADAVAWVFTSKESTMVKYPFTFPEMETTEVRIKVLHTSLCYSDVMHVRGLWFEPPFPCCVGHQIIGQVTQLGSEVTTLKVGDVVGVTPVRYSDNTCSYCTNKDKTTQMCKDRVYTYDGAFFGGFATHMQLESSWAFRVPQGLIPHVKDLPPLLCAGITVYAPLRRYCKPGSKCAVIGIGGLGHLGVQFANKLGMTVSAFTTRVNTPEPYLALGASDVQSSINEEELAKLEGTYDLVISTLYVQKPVLHRLHQRLTKPGGVFVMVGAPATKTPYILDSEYLVSKEITVAGSNVGSQVQVQDMLEFCSHYKVLPINEYFQFEDINKAFYRLQKENPRFRCVVNVTDWAKKNGFDK